jgi:hypothetical protein
MHLKEELMDMRKLVVLSVAAAFLIVSSAASAAIFDGGASFFRLKVSSLPGFLVDMDPGASGNLDVTLTGVAGSESLATSALIYSTNAATVGSALFTGVPNITNLFLTVQNGTGTFANGFTGSWQQGALGPAFGGVQSDSGNQAVLEALGYLSVPIPLNTMGLGGQSTAVVGLLTATIYVDGAPWVTSSVTITGLASNIISITNNSNGRISMIGAGFTLSPTVNESTVPTVSGENAVTSVKIGGTNDLDGTSPGQVTLVSPLYVDPSQATNGNPIAAAAFQTLIFVPEPGSMLLLGSAVVGLVIFGRKRMKR